MSKIIFTIIIIIGVLLIFSSNSMRTGSIQENGKIGLDMIFKGLILIGVGLLGLWLFKKKSE